MSRQEKDKTPVLEQEPQRVDWSRTEMHLIVNPSSEAYRRLAASMSREASRLRKSLTRRFRWTASPATQSRGSPALDVSVHTVPRWLRR